MTMQRPTFSDLVAAQQRLAESGTFVKWDARELANNRCVHPAAAAIMFAILWGVSCFGILEVDQLSLKLLIVAIVAMVSFGLDRFLCKW